MRPSKRTPLTHRRPLAPQRQNGNPVLVASAVMVVAVGLLAYFGSVAFSALTNREAPIALRTAPSAPAPAATVPADATPALASHSPADNQVPRANGGGQRVREVTEGGIAGPIIDGPLVRAPSAVALPPPPEPEPPVRLHKLVVIEDAGTIDVRSHTVRLAHISAPHADAECVDGAGQAWPCGMRARTALRRLVRRRAVDCLPLDEDAEPIPDTPQLANCSVAGIDLASWLVEHGWATPAGTAPGEMQELHAAALEKQRGLFRDGSR